MERLSSTGDTTPGGGGLFLGDISYVGTCASCGGEISRRDSGLVISDDTSSTQWHTTRFYTLGHLGSSSSWKVDDSPTPDTISWIVVSQLWFSMFQDDTLLEPKDHEAAGMSGVNPLNDNL